MPILIDQINQAAEGSLPSAQKGTSTWGDPKMFSSLLTGQGRKYGLLNDQLHPGRYRPGTTRDDAGSTNLSYKSRAVSGNVTTSVIPTGTLVPRSYEAVSGRLELPVPDESDDLALRLTQDDDEVQVIVQVGVQGLVVREERSGGKTIRTPSVCYRVTVFASRSDHDGPAVMSTRGITVPDDDLPATAAVTWSYAPVSDIEDRVIDVQGLLEALGLPTDRRRAMLGELVDFVLDVDVHAAVCAAAERWSSESVADDVESMVRTVFADGPSPESRVLDQVVYQLRYLETYGVPLSAYRRIYDVINEVADPSVARSLSRQNLNLLMNATLDALDRERGNLVTPDPSVATTPPQGRFSLQQRAPITSTDPLVIVQAAAGTGKSTTILGRVDYLIACGESPDGICVLSFTNAAADNVKARNPAIRSMTIARMINDIYNQVLPGHELSQLETIVNSLTIYFGQDPFATELAGRLTRLARNKEGAHTSVSNFIEAHLEQTVAVLDRIRQTSLELQIILCYHMIDRAPLPTGLDIRHLIIDEVQDNSIFEFVYMLDLVRRLRCSLFIVGDASQTLYEFRGSDSRALNALEASGVFTPYKLEVNYRSNQEILDFANIHLSDIEANAFSRLQLKANNLTQVTAESFKEKVALEYRHYTSDKAFREELPELVSSLTGDYVRRCLDAGEQVAFLAFSRREVSIIQDRLQEMFPSRRVASMVSDRRRTTTFFSVFIRDHWEDVMAVPINQASFVVSREVVNRCGSAQQGVVKAAQQMVSDWWLQTSAHVQGWLHEAAMGLIDDEVFFERLKQSLLDYEIRYNSVREALLHRSNQERKLRNMAERPELVVSTIHGVKGLEFDNVVVVHKSESSMSEDRKRLYYVALTRAMHSELVISHGETLSSRIKSDWLSIIKALEDRDAEANGSEAEDLDDRGVVVVEEQEQSPDPCEGQEPEQSGAPTQVGNHSQDLAAALSRLGLVPGTDDEIIGAVRNAGSGSDSGDLGNDD